MSNTPNPKRVAHAQRMNAERWANEPASELAVQRLVKLAPRLTDDQKNTLRALLCDDGQRAA